MEIEKIDANFRLKDKVCVDGEWKSYEIPHSAFSLYGVSYDETEKRFVRMDTSIAEQISKTVGELACYTAGGRLRFSTDSSCLRIVVSYNFLCMMEHMPLTGSSGFSLFEETDEGEIFIKNLCPSFGDMHGFSSEATLKGGMLRNYILYFPLYNEVKSLSIALDKNACVGKGKVYRDILPILYYGSSITQGGCASRPDNAYQALIAKWNHIDYINLGFSGSAKAEKEMAEYLAKVECSLFVCDYDHNATTVDFLQDTHYPLYKSYREKRPNTPILFLSKPDVKRDLDGEKRLRIIRKTYERAKKEGDENVYFLSGKSFYGKENCWDFSVDGCHPTDFGFYQMAKRIHAFISKNIFK